jgi:choline kinase
MKGPPTHAVVLAAGLGSRLRATDQLPKPLTPVGGRPLLDRTIHTLVRGGVRDVVVVTGFAKELVRRVLEEDAELARTGVRLHFVDNPEFHLGNGVSVLAAERAVSEPFILSMADHVYAPALVERAREADLVAADLHLCIDRNVAEVYDIDDATKVRTEGPRIVDIGKQLTDYDCIDCGVFAVTPALFAALGEVRAKRGDCSLSDGVRLLAERGRAHVVDIGDAFWQDCDTVEALERAERKIAEHGL